MTSYFATLDQDLVEKARIIALKLPLPAQDFAQLGEAAGARVTWVAADGRVLGDSEENPDAMENHRARPEIATALAGGIGSSRRNSPTLGVPFFYVAIPFEGGALRLAVPSATTDARINEIRSGAVLSTALAFVPAMILAAIFARYTSWRLGTIIDYAHQLAEGNFRTRLSRTGKSEFGVLSAKLNETSEKLEFMLARLETRARRA